MKQLDRVSVTQILTEAGCVAAGEEADELVRAAAGDKRVLEDLVSRRTDGEPIAWLTGALTFCGIKLYVAPGVYVPRWQTEPLARRAATLVPPGGVAADFCTGVGAIAAVLAAAVPTARIVATELDENAVRCARRNGVEVFEGFLDDPLPRAFERRVDVLTAVVPYVPTGSLRLLPRDVRAFEPRLALEGGVDGTDLLVQVVRRSTFWLSPGGWLLLELGGDQAEPIGQLLHDVGFEGIDVMADEDGDPRAICAQLGLGVASRGWHERVCGPSGIPNGQIGRARPVSRLRPMDWKLELVNVPVSDVDRAKAFYAEKVGFHLDNDATVTEQLRFVQLTPPGSGCSISIGTGLTDMEPGSLRGLQLVVPDIEAARAELAQRGVDVSEVDVQPWGSFVSFSDPGGNGWTVQQIPSHD